MPFSKLKNVREDSGFTIVELLIVIVVIAILATISIVAYSGIQSRSRSTKTQANAAQVQKVAEAFYADNNRYPGVSTEFNNSVEKLPTSVSILIGATALTTANGENSIDYKYVGTSATTATGGRIQYWDFTIGATATTVIYVGGATAGSTFINLAS